MISLKANNRDKKSPVSKIRAEGSIPAVVYGPKFANTSVSINYQDFVRLYNKHGETTLIAMDIDGKVTNTMIHDMELDPVSNKVIHIDFYAPEAGKKVHANVPVNFIGESAAVKAGANLVKVLHEIEVEALPENLPHSIDADISKIVTIEDGVTIADLVIPAGVTVNHEADEVVASAVAVKEEVETAPVDLSKIEVEAKGKKEEEAAPAE
jgi:large subunit ribosomal protein L25